MVSIVAKSDTGKTTLLEGVIPLLREKGVRVGVLKHHSHTSSFDVPGKDTYRLAGAGAVVVVGASAVQVAVFRQEDGSGDLDAVIRRHMADVDLVLIEGYRRGTYPKVEVHRRARSAEILCSVDELLALVTDTSHPDLARVPQIPLDDYTTVAELLEGLVR